MPGIHIFGKGDTTFVLNVQKDKEYDLMEVRERFEAPYLDFDRATKGQKLVWMVMIETEAYKVGKHAIATYERLHHWRYYSKQPPELDISDAQYDLDEFRSSSQTIFNAVDQQSNIEKLDTVAYVIKLWFIVPKTKTEVITLESTDPDVVEGTVNPYNMTEFVELPVKE